MVSLWCDVKPSLNQLCLIQIMVIFFRICVKGGKRLCFLFEYISLTGGRRQNGQSVLQRGLMLTFPVLILLCVLPVDETL